MQYTPRQLSIGIKNAKTIEQIWSRVENPSQDILDLIHRQYVKAGRYQKMLTASK